MMNSEPVISTALVQALVTAILGVLVAFGAPVNEEQRNAVLALTAALCALAVGSGVFTRSFVYSRDSVERLTGVKDPVVPSA